MIYHAPYYAFGVRRASWPSAAEILSALGMSFLLILLPNTFLTVAEVGVDSHFAALPGIVVAHEAPVPQLVVALPVIVAARDRVPPCR